MFLINWYTFLALKPFQMTYEVADFSGFQISPRYSTLRVNLLDIDKSSEKILNDVKATVGEKFTVEFHPLLEEVIIIYHEALLSEKHGSSDGCIREESIERSVVVGADCGNAGSCFLDPPPQKK